MGPTTSSDSSVRVVARPAATVVLVRPALDPSSGRLEVLLTHRPSSMAFAPDMHVFPGGRVDPTDADPALGARSAVSAADAALALGGDLEPDAALAAFVAAVRETFEETGVLLADVGSRERPPSRRALDVARAELLHVPGAFAPMVDGLDLRLRTDLLVPLSRWVTPPGLSRRFDTRFFAASLPDGAEVTLLGEEVAAHAWHTPRAALDAMAGGELGMWLPTSSTLQQLERVGSIDEIRARLAPTRRGEVHIEELGEALVRIEMPAGGGVAGQPVYAYLVGRSRLVLVDPGDPTGPALDRALDVARERGGRIVAVALTQPDPAHAAGAEAIREDLDVPVLVGSGGGHDLPFPVDEAVDGAVIDLDGVDLRIVATPGPRPEHRAFVVEATGSGPVAVVCGDLDGVRGARSVPWPPDEAAWASSVERLRAVAPNAPWHGGHPGR